MLRRSDALIAGIDETTPDQCVRLSELTFETDVPVPWARKVHAQFVMYVSPGPSARTGNPLNVAMSKFLK